MTTGNFDDANFKMQRFTYQIDSALKVLQNPNATESGQIKNKLQALCDNAENVLRPQQLIIPEGSEQTLDTARGTCLSLQQR